MRTHRHIHIFGITILLLSALAFSLSCNLDGPGIFYSIDQQVKLNESDISELKIHQVLEVGGTVYARSGTVVWEYDGDKNWDEIASGNTGSITSDGTDLYGLFFEEDLSKSSIKKYGSSDWGSALKTFNSDGLSFNAGDAVAVCYDKTDYKTETSTDFTTFNIEGNLSGDLVFAGAKAGTVYYLISKTKVYSGTTLGSLSENTNTPAELTGNFSAIASDGTNYVFVATDAGEIIYTTNGTDWDTIDSPDDEDEVFTSMAVVSISAPNAQDFLIIGTNNGYKEADISVALADASISSPNTSTTADTDSFSSKYPTLANALIFDIQAGATEGVFYLATEDGLWERDPNHEEDEPMFDKM